MKSIVLKEFEYCKNQDFGRPAERNRGMGVESSMILYIYAAINLQHRIKILV